MATTAHSVVPQYVAGSIWRRWDLHVHTPDTAREDQYPDWNQFISALRCQKEVIVVGVTDYLSITNYEKLLAIKQTQGLGMIELLIPNIEFRIAPPTRKGQAINLHLLIDPSRPDHVEQINSALSRLAITYQNQRYSCVSGELRKLGFACNSALVSDKQKLSEGVNQFKPDFSVFREWIGKEKWLADNSLIVVSAAEDGPSGLKDDGWVAVREEFWRATHLVFSGNQNNREFWLARGDSAERAIKLGAPKPCIHGSDAHRLDNLFKPDGQRYCWIKADPTFEGLRQTLYEPEERVYIGEQCPKFYDSSRVISQIRLTGGSFPAFQTRPIELNPGLVAIIGPKGSGKSALADVLAYSGGAFPARDKTTFLHRAQSYVHGLQIDLLWTDNKTSQAHVGAEQKNPKLVRYLSQSFVERLCSEDYGGTDLTKEIEGVIFGHLDPTDTLNASSFGQLRELRTRDTTRERISIAAKIRSLIAEDEKLRQSRKTLPEKKRRIEELDKEQKALEKQLPKARSESEQQAQVKVASLRQQLLAIQTAVGIYKQKLLQIEQLENRLNRFRTEFAEFRSDFLDSAQGVGIPRGVVDLELVVKGEAAITDKKSEIENLIATKEGRIDGSSEPTIAAIVEEIARTESAVVADEARKTLTQQLQKRIASILQEIQRLQNEIIELEGPKTARLKALREERLGAYEACFKSWQQEQRILAELYRPIQGKLSAGDKEEQQLDFYIKWDVSLDDWLERGNSLFDARKAHPFGSPLKLRETAERLLIPGWTSGDPDKVRRGMDSFLQEVKDKSVESSLRGSVSHAMLLEWIFDDSQIQLNYGLRYNSTELEKLSPGTKGIVLLILYLAMDVEDSRPLIVDQPEENLDSESVYSLLSRYFRKAKQRRQVIVITHNPNLVVNTDAEQIIIAAADRQHGSFPNFSYESGSLENPLIRSRVCDILEGGEKAFLQRERRYALAHHA